MTPVELKLGIKKDLTKHIEKQDFDCAMLTTYNIETEKALHYWAFSHNQVLTAPELHEFAERLALEAAKNWRSKAENPVMSEMRFGPRKKIILDPPSINNMTLGAIFIDRKGKSPLGFWAEIQKGACYFGAVWGKNIDKRTGKVYWCIKVGLGPIAIGVGADY